MHSRVTFCDFCLTNTSHDLLLYVQSWFACCMKENNICMWVFAMKPNIPVRYFWCVYSRRILCLTNAPWISWLANSAFTFTSRMTVKTWAVCMTCPWPKKSGCAWFKHVMIPYMFIKIIKDIYIYIYMNRFCIQKVSHILLWTLWNEMLLHFSSWHKAQTAQRNCPTSASQPCEHETIHKYNEIHKIRYNYYCQN